MVTAERRTSHARWDVFLRKETARLPSTQNTAVWANVARFRKDSWKTIRRELLRDYHFEVSDKAEPHWVSPGSAVYWQQSATPNGIEREELGGHSYLSDITWELGEWEPTSGLPANTASQIAHYLQKGFRLRHPLDLEKDAWKAVESAVQPMAAEEPEVERPFSCDRHAGGARYRFTTWKAYLQHCAKYIEAPVEEAPPEVIEHLSTFKWACFQHGVGFNNERMARSHVRECMRKPGRPIHSSIEQMQIKTGV